MGVLHLTSYYNPLFSSLAAFPSSAGSHLAALLLTSSLFVCFYTTCPSFACQTYVTQKLWGNNNEQEVQVTWPCPLFVLCETKKKCCSEGEGSRSVSFGGEQGVSLLSLLLQPVASLLLWLSKWLIQTSGPELNQKAVTSAAATELRLQIYVSIYARFRSYRQRALMPVLVRSDELLKRLLHPGLSVNKKGF